MSKDHQVMIRAGFSGEPEVSVLPGTGRICVIHTSSVHNTLWVESMLKLVGYFPYKIIPANFRDGYHTIVLI